MSLSATDAQAQAISYRLAAHKTFPERVWDWLGCFRSVQLAIVLLSLLCLATLAGVLLPQDGLVKTADIKTQFGENYRMFKAMGLFNVYSSYWFITLEVLFFFNLLLGSFQWLRPAFLAATQRNFLNAENILASENRFSLVSPLSASEIATPLKQLLRGKRYGVYEPAAQSTEQPLKLYATKGNFSRFGPVIAHFGILLLLVASVYGAFTGFKAQKLAVPGDTFHLMQVDAWMPNTPQSVWQGSIPEWKVRVEDFTIDYYVNRPGVPKQYYAKLAILNPDGTVRKRETISVNHPLSVGDVTIYQASFSPTGKLFLTLNDKPMKLSTNTRFQDRPVSMSELGNGISLVAFPFFVQQDPGVNENYVVLFLRDKHGFVGAAPGKMPKNLKLKAGESGTLNGMTFRYVKPEMSTGLQIKKAPEVFWMYLAYGIIILGTILCIFSQRQVWAVIRPNPNGPGSELLVMFKTNKARLSFLKELKVVHTTLHRQLQCPPTVKEAETPS